VAVAVLMLVMMAMVVVTMAVSTVKELLCVSVGTMRLTWARANGALC
jgi:hypothetical protein